MGDGTSTVPPDQPTANSVVTAAPGGSTPFQGWLVMVTVAPGVL